MARSCGNKILAVFPPFPTGPVVAAVPSLKLASSYKSLKIGTTV